MFSGRQGLLSGFNLFGYDLSDEAFSDNSDEAALPSPPLDVWSSENNTLEYKTSADDERNAQLNIFKNIKNTFVNLERELRHLLEGRLDPDIYQGAIVNGARDKYSRYQVLTQNKQDPLYYYQHVLNFLIDFQRLMDSISDIHEGFMPLLDQPNALNKAAMALWGAKQIKDIWNNFQVSYWNIYDSICALEELVTILDHLPSLESVKDALKLIGLVETIQTQWQENPFKDSYNKHNDKQRGFPGLPPVTDHADMEDEDDEEKFVAEEEPRMGRDIQQFKQIIPKVYGVRASLNEIKDTLEDLIANTEVSASARKKYEKTLKSINPVLKKIDTFAHGKKSWPKFIKLIAKLCLLLPGIINSFPDSYVLMNEVLKKHLLTTARQINLIILECFLSVDRIESHFYLQEGSLFALGKEQRISMSHYAREFNHWIERLGYEFKPKERYPFTEVIRDQRKELLETFNKEEKAPLQESFLVNRLNAQEERLAKRNALEEANKKTQLDSLLRYQRLVIRLQIDKRIAELAAEKASWILFSNIKERKIKLLKTLKSQFESGNQANCATILEKMKSENLNISLLEKGRTGVLMQTLQALTSTPSDRLRLVDQTITELQQEQARAKNYWFFKHYRQNILNKRLLAIQVLQEYLGQQGYRVKDVLRSLKAKEPEHHAMLIQYERKLLDKLKMVDSYTPDFMLGKKVVNFSEAIFNKYGEPAVALGDAEVASSGAREEVEQKSDSDFSPVFGQRACFFNTNEDRHASSPVVVSTLTPRSP